MNFFYMYKAVGEKYCWNFIWNIMDYVNDLDQINHSDFSHLYSWKWHSLPYILVCFMFHKNVL